MLTQNVLSGVGCFIDEALAGLHAIDRTFNLVVPLESVRRPLAPDTPLRAIREGAFCSLNARGEIMPFSEHAVVAGLFHKMFDDRGRVMVNIHARGAVCVQITGLTEMSRVGADVHCTEVQECNLEGRGAVVGQLLAIESLERRIGILGIKAHDDQRPLQFPGRETQGLQERKADW